MKVYMRETSRFKLSILARLISCCICICFLSEVYADDTERNDNAVIVNYGEGVTSYISDVTTFEKFHGYGLNAEKLYEFWKYLDGYPHPGLPYTQIAILAKDPKSSYSGWLTNCICSPESYDPTSSSKSLINGPFVNTNKAGKLTASVYLIASVGQRNGGSILPNFPLFTISLTADGHGVLASHTFFAQEANDQTWGLTNDGRKLSVAFLDPNNPSEAILLPVALTYDSQTPLQNIQVQLTTDNFDSLIIVNKTILDVTYMN